MTSYAVKQIKKFIIRFSKEEWTEVSTFIEDGKNMLTDLEINVKNFGWVREISFFSDWIGYILFFSDEAGLLMGHLLSSYCHLTMTVIFS